jgi:hypothetical protein
MRIEARNRAEVKHETGLEGEAGEDHRRVAMDLHCLTVLHSQVSELGIIEEKHRGEREGKRKV